jgi:hypothetical protein
VVTLAATHQHLARTSHTSAKRRHNRGHNDLRLECWALGRTLDDDGMLMVLACYAPQRQRAVRYVEASRRRGVEASSSPLPRFRPRFAPNDCREW